MSKKKILMLIGDYVEDYEVMVAFQALLMVATPSTPSAQQKIRRIRPHRHPRFRGRPKLHRKARPQFRPQRHLRRREGRGLRRRHHSRGRAVEYIRLNPRVLDMVRHFDKTKKPIAASATPPNSWPPPESWKDESAAPTQPPAST